MTILKSLCGFLLLSISLSVAAPSLAAEGGKVRVYVGTYTGPKSKGIYRMDLDLATGKSLWTSDGRMFESASLVRTGNTIFALSTSAELIALRDSETQFQQLARYKVSDTPTWAHPVLVAGGVLIKDEERVTRWSWE